MREWMNVGILFYLIFRMMFKEDINFWEVNEVSEVLRFGLRVFFKFICEFYVKC